MTAGHFTATLEVSEVRFVAPPSSPSYVRSDPKPGPCREVVEVARVVVRGASLEEVVLKIGNHADLIG